jgi:hypothetical protein
MHDLRPPVEALDLIPRPLSALDNHRSPHGGHGLAAPRLPA